MGKKIKKIKTLLFHLNLIREVWKQLREYPSAEVSVKVHQRIQGTGVLTCK